MQITIKPTIKQHEAWQALETHSEVFLGGGAGGGKSWWICETRLVKSYLYPGYKSYIGREELKRLMQSTYLTWCKVCSHHKIPRSDWKLNGQYNYIEFKNGSRIDLLDLKYLPSDPFYERFGSLEFTDGAIEEAGEIHFLAYDVLKSRVGRHLNSEFEIPATTAITGNPKKNWTYKEFYRKFRDGTLPTDTKFIQSLYNDNPYTAKIYEKQLSKITDKTTRERLKNGNWEYDDDPAILCEYDAILDLFTNTFVKGGDKYLSSDLAMKGRDRFITSFWDGFRCSFPIIKPKAGGKEIVNDLLKTSEEKAVPRSCIVADSDGMGNYLETFTDKDGIKHEGYLDDIKYFHNGAPALNKKIYANLKSECAFRLAELVNERKMLIICKDEKIKALIIEELECLKQVKVDDDTAKKTVIRKDDMKKILGRSPDFLDILIMRMLFEIKPRLEEYGDDQASSDDIPITADIEDQDF